MNDHSSRVGSFVAADTNTKFFHRKANSRRTRNRISVINDSAAPLSTHQDIASYLFNFYNKQIGAGIDAQASIVLTTLYQGEAFDLSPLLSPFTVEEVKAAVFGSAPEKAPGPHGFNSLFYQCFWGTIQQDIMEIFECFYEGYADISGINSSWICPIPKKLDVSSAKDLRPICLVHSMSKLLSKVLATRLQG